jgi:hypothetical protein
MLNLNEPEVRIPSLQTFVETLKEISYVTGDDKITISRLNKTEFDKFIHGS